MAEDEGVFYFEGADLAACPVVDLVVGMLDRLWRTWVGVEAYIAAADPGVFDPDEDIVGILQCWDWAVFEFEGLDAFEDERAVLFC